MINHTDLTPGMQKALREIMYGVRKYSDGYYSIDNPTIRVDGRSLSALLRLKLIFWQSVGGAVQQIFLSPTPEGERIFEQMQPG